MRETEISSLQRNLIRQFLILEVDFEKLGLDAKNLLQNSQLTLNSMTSETSRKLDSHIGKIRDVNKQIKNDLKSNNISFDLDNIRLDNYSGTDPAEELIKRIKTVQDLKKKINRLIEEYYHLIYTKNRKWTILKNIFGWLFFCFGLILVILFGLWLAKLTPNFY
jgi:hypothetical protein